MVGEKLLEVFADRDGYSNGLLKLLDLTQCGTVRSAQQHQRHIHEFLKLSVLPGELIQLTLQSCALCGGKCCQLHILHIDDKLSRFHGQLDGIELFLRNGGIGRDSQTAACYEHAVLAVHLECLGLYGCKRIGCAADSALTVSKSVRGGGTGKKGFGVLALVYLTAGAAEVILCRLAAGSSGLEMLGIRSLYREVVSKGDMVSAGGGVVHIGDHLDLQAVGIGDIQILQLPFTNRESLLCQRKDTDRLTYRCAVLHLLHSNRVGVVALIVCSIRVLLQLYTVQSDGSADICGIACLGISYTLAMGAEDIHLLPVIGNGQAFKNRVYIL